MLNALLDINQIEAGTVHAEKIAIFRSAICWISYAMSSPITRRRRGLPCSMVRCSLSIGSDPRLLEQMIRNLVSNALKYTNRGQGSAGLPPAPGSAEHRGLGYRDRHSGRAVAGDLRRVSSARQSPRANEAAASVLVSRSCTAWVCCWVIRFTSDRGQGKGSVFSIEVALPPASRGERMENVGSARETEGMKRAHRAGTILVIEDDPDVRELLDVFLRDEGHDVATAPDGGVALELVTRGTVTPGPYPRRLQSAERHGRGAEPPCMLREELHRAVPAIILTGDISTSTLDNIAHAGLPAAQTSR